MGTRAKFQRMKHEWLGIIWQGLLPAEGNNSFIKYEKGNAESQAKNSVNKQQKQQQKHTQ